jgi:hypothetical protein
MRVSQLNAEIAIRLSEVGHLNRLNLLSGGLFPHRAGETIVPARAGKYPRYYLRSSRFNVRLYRVDGPGIRPHCWFSSDKTWNLSTEFSNEMALLGLVVSRLTEEDAAKYVKGYD